MPGTASGAKNSKWIETLRRCSAEYQQEKETSKTGSSSNNKRRVNSPPRAAKKKEVDRAVRKEVTAAKARNATMSKTLKTHTAQSQAMHKKEQEDARKAYAEKLAKHVEDTRKAMHAEATTKALAKVQDSRRQAREVRQANPQGEGPARKRMNVKTPAPLPTTRHATSPRVRHRTKRAV